MDIETPYLIFLGDARDALAAKTGQGIVDWRPEAVSGQMRLPGCGADLGVPELTISEAADAGLRNFRPPIPLCADESIRDGSNLAGIATRYQAVNIKLDKTSGLTRDLALARQARARNMVVVVGCMVSTSLSMAPALLLSQFARFVDLDGPQLLARDRDPGLEYNGSLLSFSERVWG